MVFPSKLVEHAVDEISKLPGIGKKTALRLVLHLLKKDIHITTQLAQALHDLRTQISYCLTCWNISDQETCSICASPRRDHSIICVVEDIPDVLAIENTAQFQGLYHVLGGVISPIEGIGPSHLKIDSLFNRIRSSHQPVNEVILALSSTLEGDTTAFYLSKKLKEMNIHTSTIARGIPIGGELEYTDEVTLGRSILARVNL